LVTTTTTTCRPPN